MILIPTSLKRMNERVEIDYKRYAHPVTQLRPLYFLVKDVVVCFKNLNK